MSLTSRGRTAARRTVRVQRRIALVQVLFWPATIGTALVVAATVVLKLRANRHAESPVSAAPAAAPVPAAVGPDAPAPSRL